MAKTRHQLTQKVVVAMTAAHHGRKAKNENLRRASSRGRTGTRTARNLAPSGFAPVPASVATLPPGLGPPMSSTPDSAGRGKHHSARNSKKPEKNPEVAHGYTDVYALATHGGGAGRNNPPNTVIRPRHSRRGRLKSH